MHTDGRLYLPACCLSDSRISLDRAVNCVATVGNRPATKGGVVHDVVTGVGIGAAKRRDYDGREKQADGGKSLAVHDSKQ